MLVSGMGFIFAHFVYKGNFGEILVKIAERSIRLENYLQRATKYLKQPTTSKIQPTMTWNYQKRAKKDAKPPMTRRFWDYFTIWGNRFSSLTRFPTNIWLQSFEHCFMENDGENKLPNVFILSCVFIMEYNIHRNVANHFETGKFTFARQKSILWIKQKNQILR